MPKGYWHSPNYYPIMIEEIVERYDRQIRRFLEILPGIFSWSLILFPFWGSFWIPHYVAYFIILFDVYWFYKSANVGITSIISHFKIRAAMAYDWFSDVKKLPDWQKVHHIVVIPNYNEPAHILEKTLESIAGQDLPAKQAITVVLAMEKREAGAVEKAEKI